MRIAQLQDLIVAEAVRVLEERGERLDGAADATAAALTADDDFAARLIHRAGALPIADRLRSALAQLLGASLLAILGGGTLALLGGAGTAHALLASSKGLVNAFHALTTLLGLPTLTLLLWLVIVGLGLGRNGGAVLGPGILKLGGGLARRMDGGPAQLTMIRATAQVLARASALKWIASSISHLLWLAYLLGALVTLLIHFSTLEYAFKWETTILAERHYVAVTEAIGFLPGCLGFPVPDADTVVASGRAASATEGAERRRAWAGLILGCVVVYGLIPRGAVLALTLQLAWRAIRRSRLDTDLPGMARLRPLLMPVAGHARVVDPDVPRTEASPVPPAAQPFGTGPLIAIFGLEIDPPTSGWPPGVRGIEWLDLGFANDRGDRHHVLDRLVASGGSLRAVLIVCALTLTPDRGHLAYLRDLQRETGLAVLMLLTGGQRLRARGRPQRLAQRVGDWRRLAIEAGVPSERMIETDLDHLTAESTARLAGWLGADPSASPERPPTSIAPAFALIAEHARRWTGVPGEAERLALQQAIAGLYREAASAWPGALRDSLAKPLADAAALTGAADRAIALLPARLQLDPRWLAAGAVAGSLGCLAAATVAAPAAIAALPAWAGLGAAVAAVLQRSGRRTPPTEEPRAFGEPVAAAVLYALILHLQGRDEAQITRLLDAALGDAAPPSLPDAEAIRGWLAAVQQRLERALHDADAAP